MPLSFSFNWLAFSWSFPLFPEGIAFAWTRNVWKLRSAVIPCWEWWWLSTIESLSKMWKEFPKHGVWISKQKVTHSRMMVTSNYRVIVQNVERISKAQGVNLQTEGHPFHLFGVDPKIYIWPLTFDAGTECTQIEHPGECHTHLLTPCKISRPEGPRAMVTECSEVVVDPDVWDSLGI